MSNVSLGADATRGDHAFTLTFDREKELDREVPAARSAARPLEQSVFETEQNAVRARRHKLQNARDRTNNALTGVALSGGGIRSASFALGALQGLNVELGIGGIDYLSTVSGGGYTGCALTNTLQRTDGQFPFTDERSWADTPSVRHIRDFSNYLIPRGGTDIITAIAIICRGLVANAIIILATVLAFVWITLCSHPTRDLLGEPTILSFNFRYVLERLSLSASRPVPVWGLHGFWFTLILLGIDILFLAIWVFAKSIAVSQMWQKNRLHSKRQGDSAELQGGFASISKFLFIVTLAVALLEAQPFILYYALQEHATVKGSCYESFNVGACLSTLIHGWIVSITPWIAPAAAVVAFFSRHLGDVVKVAESSSGIMAWIKKFAAKAVVWLAAIVIPSFLWLIYFALCYVGILYDSDLVSVRPAVLLADFVSPYLGATHAARLSFELLVLMLLLAGCVNPNATSLYRLYRDRLSKAFLFDPFDQDAHGDLKSLDPKLHELDTDLCPYPVINAALNIEGSKFVNKRGRNADFFMFTPEYTGSDATGYVGTKLIEEEESALNLGTALAISGAAISPNMGSLTIRPLSLSLAILNIRLGYWLRNPRWIVGNRPLFKRLFDIRSFLLFKEMFSFISEKSRTVYLTDGGNIENLGVYALLKRQCGLIIAVDAEADPTMSFGSFLKLERYARIDLGIVIDDLPWQAIRQQTLSVDSALDDDSKGQGAPLQPVAGPHCAATEIQYGPNKRGILFYVKASLTGDESDYVLDYKRRNPDFPHETTGDQFFGEEQLEAYRALGFHIVMSALRGEAAFAVKCRPSEDQAQARQRILADIRAMA
jgi:hypothetical protein